jgi:serine protease AprX
MLRSVLSLVPLLTFGATLLAQADPRLMLHFGAFDPLAGAPAIPDGFAAAPESTLHVVQFATAPTPADRATLAALGATIHWYAPHDAFVVRVDAAKLTELAESPRVRWVGAFQPAWKVEPGLLADLVAATPAKLRLVVVMVDPKHDEGALVAAVQRVGGAMWRYAAGNLLIEADVTAAQARTLLREDTVLWLQHTAPIEVDMDNARIQGGANSIEQLGGHTGKGVRGHIMEGIYPNHPEYAANVYRTAPVAVFSGSPTSHGNSTFGINFSSGVNPQARGMCPDGQGYFTDYNFIFNTPPASTGQNSRYGVVQEITNPANSWRVMYQTASWGYPQNATYDARSAEMDWIIHEFDIPICQSQSNTGNNNSRPQAWAKNIISCGAIFHNDTANPNDDSASGTSMGPANDGRIKPDMCAYYDSIYSTNGATSYTPGFGGTSGATPIVAGHVGLILEMFTDGYFGHAAAPTWQHRFDHKPHFTTTKALLINTARQYDPAIVGAGAAWRFRQGWGFPAVNDLHDLRRNILVLDELDVLPHGGSRNFWVHVKPGTPQFRSTMVYADLPAAVPFLAPHRVNDLSLRVFAPGGAIYHGNNGMSGFPTALFTAPGGSPNTLDTVENVFVQNPAYGLWRLEVSAPLVAIDQHVETPAVDADFALVASGIGGGRDVSGPLLDLASTPGALSLALTNLPASYTDGFVMFSFATARPLAMGNFLGLELDSLSFLSLTAPATPGDPLHFPPTAVPTQFPNAPFVFPAWLPQLLQGATIDAVAFCFDATGAMRAASNVDRVTVQ